MRRLVPAALVLLAALWLAAAALAEGRVALVIGNSNYKTVESLKNPQNDAMDVSVALEGLGFDVILGRDLTREKLIGALESMRNYDAGGYPVSFSPTDHNGSNFVELTVLRRDGKLMR